VHEHEAPEAAERRKPRADVGSSVGGPGLLSLQQQAGNRAVAGAVARAVQIDEMTSNVNVRDEAKLTPEVQEEVGNALHAGGGGGAGATEEQPTGGGAATDEQQSTGGGADTLPPGGHATMEEEPG
jgi:hypothetical protein